MELIDFKLTLIFDNISGNYRKEFKFFYIESFF